MSGDYFQAEYVMIFSDVRWYYIEVTMNHFLSSTKIIDF